MSVGEKKVVAALVGAVAALSAACLFLLFVRESTAVDLPTALADPTLRAELVQQLSADAIDIWDSHNDPEVGRMILPHLDRFATNARTRTNALGLREKDFALPKPAGLLRIVFLGDSFIQGFNVEEGDRVGVFLERYLREHASGWSGELECLHIGVGGWNTVSECAYLRRLLGELAPDLVLHVLVTNDLDDHMGVRGFGGLSAFAPLEREHTDARVSHGFGFPFTHKGNTNYLLIGADWESRHRYQLVADSVARLVPAVRQSGARYLLLSHFGTQSNKPWSFLKDVLTEREFAALPARLYQQEDLIFSPTDQHWSRKGHELVAQLTFTLIRTLDLLPELRLRAWPEVEEPCLAELRTAWKAAHSLSLQSSAPPREALSSLEPAHFGDLEWRHVYTGLDPEGRVSPFASFYLAREGQYELTLRGRGLDRPELAGARLRVSIEGQPAGEYELVPGQAFELRLPLPPTGRRRSGLNVRMETSDYVYAGLDRQHCVSFVLERLALE